MVDELYHHGVKNQKWGERRYQNEDGTRTLLGKERRRQHMTKAVNSMYDHSNKWTERKIKKLEKRGKIAKANVMKELIRQNEQHRKLKTDYILNPNSRIMRTKVSDLVTTFHEPELLRRIGDRSMMSVMSRIGDYNRQRGIRWESNFTSEQKLASMTPQEGLEYLQRKRAMKKSSTAVTGHVTRR